MSIINLFNFKISRLTAKRDAALAAGALETALRQTDEIITIIAAEIKLRNLAKAA